MKPTEHTITLDRAALRCLERGGSISCEIKPGTVVWIALKSDTPFNFPSNAPRPEVKP